MLDISFHLNMGLTKTKISFARNYFIVEITFNKMQLLKTEFLTTTF